METIVVHGGRPLHGSVQIPGAKNSALPLMAAAMLCKNSVTLTNVPALSDVKASLDILRSLGCDAGMAADVVAVNACQVAQSAIPADLMRVMRSSIFFLAPLLVRTGHAEISRPGGCNLGERPIDIHLDGLQHMGVTLCENGETLLLKAPEDGLHATEFLLRFPSVGATETLVMAAVGAKGITRLHNVAREPEIIDLVRFLCAMGAKIEGAGTSHLIIHGGTVLRSTRFAVCPDRVVAATVLCAVAACGGDVLVKGCAPEHLSVLWPLLEMLGCVIERGIKQPNILRVRSAGPVAGLGLQQTAVYPGLPTDMAPLLAAAALRARSATILNDTIFTTRFACAAGFAAAGACVERKDPALLIQGVPALRGAAMHAQDLRGGAALVLAALQANGESVITGTENIRRGYDDIVAMFAQLGADIVWREPLEAECAPVETDSLSYTGTQERALAAVGASPQENGAALSA